MRIVFLTLVLANVVAFIWYGWLKAPMQAAQQMTPLPHVRPLKLISELTPAERQSLVKASTPAPRAQAVTPETAAIAVTNAPQMCMSYGPFPSTETEKIGVTRLQKAGATITQRTVPGKVRLGYWVYLPPFGSRREAEAAAKLLKARGVKDIYVVNDEANRNAISLGLYRDRYGALAHQKTIRALGYRPLLTERFRDVPNYWLDARGAAKQLPLADAFADLGEGDVKIERQTCGPGT
jgi:SPOR domain